MVADLCGVGMDGEGVAGCDANHQAPRGNAARGHQWRRGQDALKKKHPPSLYIVIAWCIKQCKSIDYHCVTMFSSIIGQQSWFDFGFTRSPE
jgi:hypothetical protein